VLGVAGAIVGAAAGGVGSYVAIKVQLARIEEQIGHAKGEATRANNRIDQLLQRGD
jgi:outer membrane murein-binding lipoprotein Lpp